MLVSELGLLHELLLRSTICPIVELILNLLNFWRNRREVSPLALFTRGKLLSSELLDELFTVVCFFESWLNPASIAGRADFAFGKQRGLRRGTIFLGDD